MATPIKYHRDIYLPQSLELEALTILVCKNGQYALTEHARERAAEKGVRLPERIPFRECRVVEVTTVRGRIQKFLVRFDHGDGHNDVCVSYTREGRVATCYLNRKNDRHRTLDVRQYAVA